MNSLSKISGWRKAGIVLALAAGPSPGWGLELSNLDCLIEPYAVVEVSTRSEGIIESVAVDRGDSVEKGQALVVLESGVERVTVSLAKAKAKMDVQIRARQASLDFNRRQLERTDDLYKKKAIPFHEHDQAATDVVLAELELLEVKQDQRVAQLELERAQAVLERRTIRSRIDGVVVERLMSPGESVEGKPLLKLAQLDPLNVEVIVPASALGLITPGMKASVTPLTHGAKAYRAEVSVVDRVVDARSGTYGVRLELSNPGNQIVSGVRCHIEFDATE